MLVQANPMNNLELFYPESKDTLEWLNRLDFTTETSQSKHEPLNKCISNQ